MKRIKYSRPEEEGHQGSGENPGLEEDYLSEDELVLEAEHFQDEPARPGRTRADDDTDFEEEAV